MKDRFLPIRLTLPIPKVNDNWPELLLPWDMTSEAWDRMLALLEVMRPGVVSHGDKRPVIASLVTVLNRVIETKESTPSSKKDVVGSAGRRGA